MDSNIENNIENINLLNTSYNNDKNILEIGVDEVGRGPLFGRVYSAAVILPKDNFDFSKIKDSKKFHSSKKIINVSNYIKENCIAYSICYEDENIIDSINILQATQSAMHKAIKEVIKKIELNKEYSKHSLLLLIDGNYFNEYTYLNNNKIMSIPHIKVIGGDNCYASIAAASILAKVERDNYIMDLCIKYPVLIEYYGLNSNKGYGAKKHIDGINKYGITIMHRKSFNPCKNKKLITLTSQIKEEIKEEINEEIIS